MTMEKRGVISESTPGGCCGGGCHSTEKSAATEHQQTLPFPGLREPQTEKQADALQESTLNNAIDAVAEETDGSPE